MHDDCKLLTKRKLKNVASSVHGIFKTMRLQKDIIPYFCPDKFAKLLSFTTEIGHDIE